jgi:hypothetical protein
MMEIWKCSSTMEIIERSYKRSPAGFGIFTTSGAGCSSGSLTYTYSYIHQDPTSELKERHIGGMMIN